MTIENNEFIRFLESNGFNRNIPIFKKWKFDYNEGVYNPKRDYRVYKYDSLKVTLDGYVCYVSKNKKILFSFSLAIMPGWQDPVTLFTEIPHKVIYLINNKCLKPIRIAPVPISRYISKSVRTQVFFKFNNTCNYCGSKEILEVDHIHPISKGGSSLIQNLQILCKTCNLKKSNKLLSETFTISHIIL